MPCRHCEGTGEEPYIKRETFFKTDRGFDLRFMSLSTGAFRIETPDGHRFDDIPRWLIVALAAQLKEHLEDE